ncbi:ParM/StbA family protein [Carnobacterium gallinarum]|uniref:ParM/StbA family protein n=1 Tax=Carnobacterium gallinarum TaxID=2749 RepID=UPI00068E8758|nr:ParM/StbA family protein [Carnobacterium gallinarum]
MKIVVIDPGKNEVKSFCFSDNGNLELVNSFPSKTREVIEERFLEEDSSLRQYRMELDGDYYMIGEGVDTTYNTELTKNTLHHKLCIYATIADYVTEPDEEILLVLGYPSTDFQNNFRREDYQNLIFGDKNGHIEFAQNGEPVSFQLMNVIVLPEGQAMLPRMTEVDDYYSLYVLDIGGQNVNFREFDNKGNAKTAFSIDVAGVNFLERALEAELRRAIENPNVNFRGIDYNKAILEGKITDIGAIEGFADSTSFITNVVQSFVKKEIMDELAVRGYNINARGQHIIFTGGGSLLLQPYIEDLLKGNKTNLIFSKSAKWDNCLSYTIKAFQDQFTSNEQFTSFIKPIYGELMKNNFSDFYKDVKQEESTENDGTMDFNRIL